PGCDDRRRRVRDRRHRTPTRRSRSRPATRSGRSTAAARAATAMAAARPANRRCPAPPGPGRSRSRRRASRPAWRARRDAVRRSIVSWRSSEMLPARRGRIQPCAVMAAHAHALAGHDAADPGGAATEAGQVGLHLGEPTGWHAEAQLVIVTAAQGELQRGTVVVQTEQGRGAWQQRGIDLGADAARRADMAQVGEQAVGYVDAGMRLAAQRDARGQARGGTVEPADQEFAQAVPAVVMPGGLLQGVQTRGAIAERPGDQHHVTYARALPGGTKPCTATLMANGPRVVSPPTRASRCGCASWAKPSTKPSTNSRSACGRVRLSRAQAGLAPIAARSDR